MYDFNFICRASKCDKKKLSPIELSVTINGKRTYIALPLKINAVEFKKKMSSKRNNEVLEYVSAIRMKLNQFVSELIIKELPITPQTIKEYFLIGGVKSYTFAQLGKDFLKYYTAKEDAGCVTTNVVRKYELAFEKFYNFIGKDFEINSLTSVQIEEFKISLKKDFEDSTIAHLLKRLKTMFKYACDNRKLDSNPFNQVKITFKEKEVEKLTVEELELIKRKSFVGRLGNVKDLFLFQCYTGLAYCDMANFVKSDIQFDEHNNMYYINKPRQKTSIMFFTVLNADAMEVLKKYDYSLPVLSNQKYNAYLKEIGDICQLNKNLHSHLARHTCATNLLNDGMPLEIVAKVLGHTNTRQTQHYAKLLDKTVLNAFKKIG